MILLTLQTTVLKTNFTTSLLWNFEKFPLFPKMLFSGCVIEEGSLFIYHYQQCVVVWSCIGGGDRVTPLDTAQSYKSFAPSWLIIQPRCTPAGSWTAPGNVLICVKWKPILSIQTWPHNLTSLLTSKYESRVQSNILSPSSCGGTGRMRTIFSFLWAGWV